VGHFGDFIIHAETKITGRTTAEFSILLGLSNQVDDFGDWTDGLVLMAYGSGGTHLFRIQQFAEPYDNYLNFLLDTSYYFTFIRSGTTLTCKIYSDAARQNLLDTLSVAVDTTTFRYLYVTGSQNIGVEWPTITGYVQNVKILLP
jgi:hypothetical protein